MSNKRTLFQASLKKRFVRQQLKNKEGTKSQNTEADENDILEAGIDAKKEVEKILKGERSSFHILPWKQHCGRWRERANFYQEFSILGEVNTKEDVGWAVCNYVLSGSCSADEGVKKYIPKKENGAFHRHGDSHSRNDNKEKK